MHRTMALLRQLGCSVSRRSLRRLFSAATEVSEKAEAASLTDMIMEKEKRFGARNIRQVPVALTRGSGVFLWDVEGKRYFDFHSGYSTVNQGHRHPRIIAAMAEQASKLTLTSRGFYNDALGEFEEMVTEMFGYDKMMPMNTGVEAVETGVKLARRWGYDVKGIAENRAKVYFAEGNFHGRSLLAVSASTDPENYGGYGPYVPNVFTVPYNDLDKLEVYPISYNLWLSLYVCVCVFVCAGGPLRPRCVCICGGAHPGRERGSCSQQWLPEGNYKYLLPP